MDYSPIYQLILAVISSGSIGAAITYIFTFSSKKKEIEAQTESKIVDVQQKKWDLKQDQYDYFQKTCDKYIKDYHELEKNFRQQVQDLRDQTDKIMLEKSKEISNKCNEIMTLKQKINYLKGLQCFDFSCQKRLKVNPNKHNVC